MELQGQGITIAEMLNVMAAQQPMYTVPAYGSLEANYAQYPQYVTQMAHAAYLATPAAPQVVTHAAIANHAADMEKYEDSHRSRERREHRNRDRDRRSRDRDRDRNRDRRDRDRDRDRRDRDREHRHRDNDRERSPRRDRDRDYDRDSLYDEDSRGSDYKSMPPNNTIMVRGLAQHIKENDIRADILDCKLTPKDIRLVRKKESGASRGFAFVEFATVHDAARWMDSKQGVLILQDVYRATLQYSIPRDSSDRTLKIGADWFCVRCTGHNFKKRDSCFKCGSPRYESELGEDGNEEICSYPTNTLIIRGLDVLSTEENVLLSIEQASSDLPIKSVRIGRDPLTNTSRGVCYVELNSVLDSMQLYNKLTANPPVVDGKQTTIAYWKLHQGNNHSSSSQPQTHQPLEYTAGADIKKLAEYSASVYAQTPEEHHAYVEYYTLYYQQQAEAASSSTQSDSVNAAAAVAQSALQAMQQKTAAVAAVQSRYSSPVTTVAQTTEAVEEYPRYPTPDITNYTYDETSGYYYDDKTGLYYDANSTYYYNSETSQFLYWDSERSTYLPAPTGDETQDGQNMHKDRKEKDNKQDKVKVAKKIAKDMARWAKAQNKRNETVFKSTTPEQDVTGSSSSGGMPTGPVADCGPSGAADAVFAMMLERRTAPVDKQSFQMHVKKDNHSTSSVLRKPGLVAAYGGDNSESEEEKEMTIQPEKSEQMLIDVVKMACLLCKRQFPNKDALTKHVKLSSLHRTNLEAYARSAEGDMLQYRDRAKERRNKYGQPHVPAPNKLKERYIAAKEDVQSNQYEEPTREGIGEDNVGNKLMKKMGWTDGMGLGKTNQGRTEIIEAERRIASAGLGMQGSAYSVAGDSYKDCVKKMMYHRYQELDAAEKSHK